MSQARPTRAHPALCSVTVHDSTVLHIENAEEHVVSELLSIRIQLTAEGKKFRSGGSGWRAENVYLETSS
jgi:hypothetical protein